GGRLPGDHPGSEGGRAHGPALQPHPRPGGGAGRPHLDRPAGPHRREWQPRRTPPHDPHHHDRAHRPAVGGTPGRARRPRRGGRRRRRGPLPGRRRPRGRGGPGARAARGPLVGRTPADAGAAPHAALRRRRRGRTMSAPTRDDTAVRTRSPLAGTRTLVRFYLRKDRIKLPAWVGGLGLIVVYVGSALPTLAPTEDDLAALPPIFSQPVGRMFTGPAFGMEAPTYERFFAGGYAPYLFLLAALMSIMLVTRHTRVEEQTGRAELIRANVTGRHSALTAALLVALITTALAFAVVTLAQLAIGFAPVGSVLVGLGTALTGMAFAGITAVTVQLSEYSRSAAGMAGVALGVSFVLRALGDMAGVGGTALSWASPLGWPAQTAPFVHDRWAPLIPLLLLAVAGVVSGYALQDRRDFGASLIAPRPGPAHAGRSLSSPLGLAARLQRGAFLGWGIGILALGAVDGAFTQAMLDAGDDMPPAFA